MSYTKQTTIWCDEGWVRGCHENLQVDTNRVGVARDEAESIHKWTCGPDGDVCPVCRKEVEADDGS